MKYIILSRWKSEKLNRAWRVASDIVYSYRSDAEHYAKEYSEEFMGAEFTVVEVPE